MARPPLFDRAMTVAERVRRHRARKRPAQAQLDPVPSEADLRRWLVLPRRAEAGEDAPTTSAGRGDRQASPAQRQP